MMNKNKPHRTSAGRLQRRVSSVGRVGACLHRYGGRGRGALMVLKLLEQKALPFPCKRLDESPTFG